MKRRVCSLAALAAPLAVGAQDVPGRGALDGLMVQREGRIAHYASTDPSGGNADFVVIAPGETHTLLSHDGAGIVRRWWLTIAPRDNAELQRQLIARCYWDSEAEPSVEVPVADFFGMGLGEWRDYQSLPPAPPLPDELLPFLRVELTDVEAERLLDRARTSGGALRVQGMEPSAERLEPTGPISCGRVPLQVGTNEVVVEVIGKDARSAGYSDGYLVGIDGFTLGD